MILSKEDLKAYLNLDAIALGHRRSLKHILAPDVIWEFQKCLRKLEYYTNTRKKYNLLCFLYYKYRFRKLSLKLNFTIPINVFGPGLSIAHYGTIIVSSNAKVGRFCRIHASTNIGASAGQPEAPCIGNNVYIGPGAILFGDIQIADDITIAANATVNKSCNKTNVILAGTPAKIVKEDYPNWKNNNQKNNH